ncbi:MAG: DUF4835 family protein [Ignavibacteria bacterium]|nr:DUF4835 family protein [Ignavibacteria bacterium]
MQTQIKWFFIIVFILLSIADKSHSQSHDLQVEVIVDMTQLPPDVQDKLRNFKQRTEEYLNKNKYFDETGPLTPIKVQMQFNFTGVDNVNLDYQAQIFIASQREVYNPFNNGNNRYSVAFRYLDERCNFYYQESMVFLKNDYRFDSFLSLLDYYAYIIAGYDEDSYFVKGGNKYFQKALDICNKVTGSLRGWNETGGGSKPSRLQLVQEILDVRSDGFRKAYFEYMWTGLDSLALNKTHAYKNILDALDAIGAIKKKEVRSFNIDIFFDSKANEIAEVFLNYGDRRVYDRLMNIDRSHQSIYEEAKKRAM